MSSLRPPFACHPVHTRVPPVVDVPDEQRAVVAIRSYLRASILASAAPGSRTRCETLELARDEALAACLALLRSYGHKL